MAPRRRNKIQVDDNDATYECALCNKSVLVKQRGLHNKQNHPEEAAEEPVVIAPPAMIFPAEQVFVAAQNPILPVQNGLMARDNPYQPVRDFFNALKRFILGCADWIIWLFMSALSLVGASLKVGIAVLIVALLAILYSKFQALRGWLGGIFTTVGNFLWSGFTDLLSFFKIDFLGPLKIADKAIHDLIQGNIKENLQKKFADFKAKFDQIAQKLETDKNRLQLADVEKQFDELINTIESNIIKKYMGDAGMGTHELATKIQSLEKATEICIEQITQYFTESRLFTLDELGNMLQRCGLPNYV